MNSSTALPDRVHPEKPRPKARALRTTLFIIVPIAVVFALALGLGLGLGLKKHNNGSNDASSSDDDSLASMTVQSWRRATEDYLLDMNWDINAAPTTRVYNLTVGEISIAPDGVTKTVLAINGQYPGPLIRMNRGDRLLVNLTNNLPNATTLHWHGMFQNRTNWMDGTSGVTQCPVPPGKSFIYNFTVENQFGTYWYHAHFSTQYTDGIIGPLIIHAPEEAQTRQLYDYDQVVMMQDWYHDLTSGLIPVYLAPDNENNEPVPDNGLIQGEGYYNCSNLDPDSGYECADNSTRAVFSITQNKRYRLRFINAGAITTFQISVDNHTLDVIEADGVLTEPLPVHRFDIAVAERYSVILNANQSSSSNYWIRAWMNLNCFAGSTDSLDPNVKALITYTNTTSAPTNSVDWDDALDIVCQDLNNTLLVPSDIQQAPPADVLYQVSFSFGIRDNALDRAYINGTSWSANIENPTLNQAVSGLQASNVNFTKVGVVSSAYSSNQLVISLPTVQVVDILIQNFDDGSHPFHLHGHVFWVMATSVEQYFPWDTDYYNQLNSTTTNDYNKNPMRRDTLVIPEYGWALIRFRNDNPGQWALHCHISWHMEAGLFMQFVSLQDEIKALGLPSDVLALCNSTST